MLPPLRPLHSSAVRTEDGLRVVVRDPLGLLPEPLLLTPELYWMGCHFDGTAGVPELVDRFRERFPDIDEELVERARLALDEHLLLASPRFERALASARGAFLAQAVRPLRHAEGNYPDGAEACRIHLDRFLRSAGSAPAPPRLRALVSPHIDFPRGRTAYARTWGPLRDLAVPPRRVVALGTSHAPLGGWIGLGSRPYQTPYGTLPNDEVALEHLRAALPAELHGEEYCHAQEHSLEFQAVLCAHVFPEACFVPVLVGPLGPAAAEGCAPAAHGSSAPHLEALVAALADLDDGSTLFVAGVDLAHIGPHFGQTEELSAERLELLEREDRTSLERLAARDTEGFWSSVASGGDPRNVCGTYPLYLLSSLLAQREPGPAHLVAYERCTSADQCVSIAGMWFE